MPDLDLRVVFPEREVAGSTHQGGVMGEGSFAALVYGAMLGGSIAIIYFAFKLIGWFFSAASTKGKQVASLVQAKSGELLGTKNAGLEDELYARAMKEVESSERQEGLWAKAYAKAGGVEHSAKAKYVQMRVQMLRNSENDSDSVIDSIDKSERVAGSMDHAVKGPSSGKPNIYSGGGSEANKLNQLDACGYTALMAAVEKLQASEVDRLLALGADPNVVAGTWGSQTALDIAKQELKRAKSALEVGACRRIIQALGGEVEPSASSNEYADKSASLGANEAKGELGNKIDELNQLADTLRGHLDN